MATIVIPARGGSKGLKNKNLAEVGGKSLLGRAITTCQKVTVNHVYVSSDSREILYEAERWNATPVIRPEELAQDDTSSIDVVRHIAPICDELIVMVQCTAPLLTPHDITACVGALSRCDVACAVVPFHGFVIHNGECVNHALCPVPRRQEHEQQWQIAGSCWAFRKSYIMENDLYAGRVEWVPAEISHHLDIDTRMDLVIARAMIPDPVPILD